jgi:hypothetical protein
MTDELGRKMFAQNVILHGKLPEDRWRAFLPRAVQALGMSPVGEPALWHYPIEDDKGGVGMTICQPLTESFLVLDTWDDHFGAYLHISSCKKFDVAAIVAPAREFDLGVKFIGRWEILRLEPEPKAFHWDAAEKARRDGYVEFSVGPNDDP